MATWANVRQKVIDLYQAGKLIPNVNVYRWAEGSQSNGAVYSIIWKTYKLDFSLNHAWLYGRKADDPEEAATLLDDTAADMTSFANTIENDMPWPDNTPVATTASLDDAYAGLVEVESEE